MTTTIDPNTRLDRIEARLDGINSRLNGIEQHMVSHKDLLIFAGAILGVNITVVGAASAALYFAMSNLTAIVLATLPHTT
jgi:hypothetical protein